MSHKTLKSLKYHDTNGFDYQMFGNPSAPNRVWIHAGQHGNEIAGPLAQQLLAAEVWPYDNVYAMFVMQDPKGYADEGYGFVGVSGNESCWPPLWGYHKNKEQYWQYYDENSTWGSYKAVTPRHLAMRKRIDDFRPTFCLNLHETVETETERTMFWCGAGILLIENYPLSYRELMEAADVEGSPAYDPLAWTLRLLYYWIIPRFGKRRWNNAKKALKNNDGFNLCSKIADRYVGLGGKLPGANWTQVFEEIGEVVVGPGRVIFDPWTIDAEWLTLAHYATVYFGCPSVTTETFPPAEIGLRGIDQRVSNQLAYVKATLEVLND